MVEPSTYNSTCWYVGASWDDGDQMERFLEQGIWENGYDDKYLSLVKSVQPGDRIAIKAAYTQKYDLPFDNRGYTTSVMGIKAIGKVTANKGDGRHLEVSWQRLSEPRKWYFYTNRMTIWKVTPSVWEAENLIDFTFNNANQEIDRFRNAPYWRGRFGDRPERETQFLWTKFYQAIADKLLDFRHDRSKLIKGIQSIADRGEAAAHVLAIYTASSKGPLTDICPFTAMGMFNRRIKDEHRKMIAGELASFLGVEEFVPETFEGIPILNNQRSWFFGGEDKRQSEDIETLWQLFEHALEYADGENTSVGDLLTAAYDRAATQYGVGWNITMGLYWIRPWNFLTLDQQSRLYISKNLKMNIEMDGPQGRCSSKNYIDLLDAFETRFKEVAFPVHSYPELSQAAWLYQNDDVPQSSGVAGDDDDLPEDEKEPAPITPYGLDDIIKDGSFIGVDRLRTVLERLRTKRNIILQGPPGTGKTWLGKRLGFALMEEKDATRLRAVQFHPNMSYEDFIMGWRPSSDGKLDLVKGPFLQIASMAKKHPSKKYVIVIEEINRGNPAQIFGEVLTLLEVDKRTPAEKLELSYSRGEAEYIPDNLYVIGTMNVADRSLALVDMALRRRFAFIDLEPELGSRWRDWVHERSRIDLDLLDDIRARIQKLNITITDDSTLGPQFRIGHSYVTPALDAEIKDPQAWFTQVVETEIGPLLDEYWFDNQPKATKERDKLLAHL